MARKIRRALLSVYDKTGLIEFARALHEEFGVELISTGGTSKTLKDAGLPVTLVEEVTGFPELLDGRVKTLHPKIHAAILADRDNLEHMRQLREQGIEPIDMVVVNLYPFEQTIGKPGCKFEEAIEMIDIGGPCLLRAAAKNHRHVVVLGDPKQYDEILGRLRLDEGSGDTVLRLAGASSVFEKTSAYDLLIDRYFGTFFGSCLQSMAEKRGEIGRTELPPAHALLALDRWRETRYGENPHQDGSVWALRREIGIDHRSSHSPGAQSIFTVIREDQVELSFNNCLDASAAFGLCAELTRAAPSLWGRSKTGLARDRLQTAPTVTEERLQTGPADSGRSVVFIKHTNCCGAAVRADPVEAYRAAYLGDPNAALGGILAVNFPVDVPFAEAVMETYARWGKAAGAGGFFVEVWVAPSFVESAVEWIRTKKDWGKRVRLLAGGDMSTPPDPRELDFKRIAGGMLVQTRDLAGLNEEQWKVVTTRAPTESEVNDLRLAWLICKHTRSNAITICRDGMLIGNGAGQMSRVMSCRIATWLAKENGHADRLTGAVAASDAFFPFRDGPDILMAAGVTALIQPGGSKRDAEVIAACDERGVAMIFTGTRHFKH